VKTDVCEPQPGSGWSFGPGVAHSAEGSVPRLAPLGQSQVHILRWTLRRWASGSHLRTSIYVRGSDPTHAEGKLPEPDLIDGSIERLVMPVRGTDGRTFR
jgi:hypothetical protein